MLVDVSEKLLLEIWRYQFLEDMEEVCFDDAQLVIKKHL